jgi:hypothetical protein
LKIKGLLGGIGWWRTISASILREFGDIRGLQHPRCASTDLLGLQSTERNHAVHCPRTYLSRLTVMRPGDSVNSMSLTKAPFKKFTWPARSS